MLYTVGNSEVYASGITESYPVRLKKLGISADYEGGSIWLTKESALTYLDNNPGLPFEVFAVDTDQNNIYKSNSSVEWFSLINDSDIYTLEEELLLNVERKSRKDMES